jgi:hypothetical protein
MVLDKIDAVHIDRALLRDDSRGARDPEATSARAEKRCFVIDGVAQRTCTMTGGKHRARPALV